jgi:hypothetical protein
LRLHPEQLVGAGTYHIKGVGIGDTVNTGEVVGNLGDGWHIVNEAIAVAIILRGGHCLGGAVGVIGSTTGLRDRQCAEAESSGQHPGAHHSGPHEGPAGASRDCRLDPAIDRRCTAGRHEKAACRTVAEITAVHSAVAEADELIEPRRVGRNRGANGGDRKQGCFKIEWPHFFDKLVSPRPR